MRSLPWLLFIIGVVVSDGIDDEIKDIAADLGTSLTSIRYTHTKALINESIIFTLHL